MQILMNILVKNRCMQLLVKNRGKTMVQILVLQIQKYALQRQQVSHILILVAWFCFGYINWVSIKKKICRLLLFEKGDPRYMRVRKFGLSERVVDVLFDEESLISLNQLIIMRIYTPEDLLEIEDLEEKDKEEIVRKIDQFVNNSWALTALFYCNFDKLKVKPWWCRLIVYISRKRKDPAFFFISELRLSTRITSFLMEEKIYTIEDLLIIIKDTHSSKWRRFVQSEELAYIDLIEIYTTVHNFLHC